MCVTVIVLHSDAFNMLYSRGSCFRATSHKFVLGVTNHRFLLSVFSSNQQVHKYNLRYVSNGCVTTDLSELSAETETSEY